MLPGPANIRITNLKCIIIYHFLGPETVDAFSGRNMSDD